METERPNCTAIPTSHCPKAIGATMPTTPEPDSLPRYAEHRR